MTADRPLETNPPQPLGTVVLLHGLGASGDDLFPLADLLLGGNMRVVCPHAPHRPVAINGGFTMRAWYDIRQPNLPADYDDDGIAASAEQINALIDAEIAGGMPPQKVFLAGFSQGAAMALHVGLRRKPQLAGIVALSGYLLYPDQLPPAPTETGEATIPIFQAHGQADPVVLPVWGRQSRDALLGGGYPVSYHEYPMAHAILPQEIDDINKWLNQQLTEKEQTP